MDSNDPEQRIADLERQLAERSAGSAAGAHATGGGLTAEQVHSVKFSKPPWGKRGYNVDDVDAFLDRIEATLRDPSASGVLTPADVAAVLFDKPPIGKRGYNEDQVDDFLKRVEAELARRSPRRGG